MRVGERVARRDCGFDGCGDGNVPPFGVFSLGTGDNHAQTGGCRCCVCACVEHATFYISIPQLSRSPSTPHASCERIVATNTDCGTRMLPMTLARADVTICERLARLNGNPNKDPWPERQKHCGEQQSPPPPHPIFFCTGCLGKLFRDRRSACSGRGSGCGCLETQVD